MQLTRKYLQIFFSNLFSISFSFYDFHGENHFQKFFFPNFSQPCKKKNEKKRWGKTFFIFFRKEKWKACYFFSLTKRMQKISPKIFTTKSLKKGNERFFKMLKITDPFLSHSWSFFLIFEAHQFWDQTNSMHEILFPLEFFQETRKAVQKNFLFVLLLRAQSEYNWRKKIPKSQFEKILSLWAKSQSSLQDHTTQGDFCFISQNLINLISIFFQKNRSCIPKWKDTKNSRTFSIPGLRFHVEYFTSPGFITLYKHSQFESNGN